MGGGSSYTKADLPHISNYWPSQVLYEGYVKDDRLTQIEYLVLKDQISDLVKVNLKTVKQSSDNQLSKTVIYPTVNKDNQLTL